MKHLFVLACAGALGTLSRYGLSGLAHRLFGAGFPWGTALVNLLGCLLFGMIWTLIESRSLLPAALRPYLLTGFMGALTTFSTWIFESSQLLNSGRFLLLAVNLVAQVLLGLSLFYAGVLLARLL